MIEPDADLRTLTRMKANYARKGDALQLRWSEGLLRRVADEVSHEPLAAINAIAKADEVFLKLVACFQAERRQVSPAPGSNFAPAVFASDERSEGVRKTALRVAMGRLFAAGKIAVDETGPPSRRRSTIVVVRHPVDPTNAPTNALPTTENGR